MREIRVGDRVLITKNGKVDKPGRVTRIVTHDGLYLNCANKEVYFYGICFDGGDGCNLFVGRCDESIELDLSRIREELINELL